MLLAQAGREGGRGPWAALRDGAGAARDGAAPAARGSAAGDVARPRCRPPTASGSCASRAFFAAERARAERLPPEALLERAIAATGYDLAILARAGGERRLANLRKLMRLAREYEHAEGRDLRGFLDFAATQDLAEAREGEAALESEGLDAVRLMTIHRAKGLEFPVVCVADLGRLGAGGRAAAADRPRRHAPACGSPRSAAATPCRRSPTSGSRPRRTARTPRRSAGCSTSR